jgi:hypothetical protein
MTKYIKSITVPVWITKMLSLPDPWTPYIARQAERKLQKLKGKVSNILSSYSRAEFESFSIGQLIFLIRIS